MVEDTIAAIATPLGEGGLAIIRISGPLSFEIASRCFSGKDPRQAASHTVHHGRIVGSPGTELEFAL